MKRALLLCLTLMTLAACDMNKAPDDSDCDFFNNCKCMRDWYNNCSVQG